MTSMPLNVKSMTPCPVRGQVTNYEARGPGCMWLSSQMHMCAPHMWPLLAANASSSHQIPSFIRISVSGAFRSYVSFGMADGYDAQNIS